MEIFQKMFKMSLDFTKVVKENYKKISTGSGHVIFFQLRLVDLTFLYFIPR